jgi:hypothetical protein
MIENSHMDYASNRIEGFVEQEAALLDEGQGEALADQLEMANGTEEIDQEIPAVQAIAVEEPEEEDDSVVPEEDAGVQASIVSFKRVIIDTPQPVLCPERVRSVAGGYSFTIVISESGKLFSFGFNDKGEKKFRLGEFC